PPYLAEHIPEEREHDDWLLEDLELLGEDRSSVSVRPPSPTVAAAVGAQYYWILHYHPVALLGYIAFLEGYPPSIELVDELVDRTGHNRGAFRTLIAHAELDPGHRDELDAVLDRLPVTREQSTAMGLSAIYSVQTLARGTRPRSARRSRRPPAQPPPPPLEPLPHPALGPRALAPGFPQSD